MAAERPVAWLAHTHGHTEVALREWLAAALPGLEFRPLFPGRVRRGPRPPPGDEPTGATGAHLLHEVERCWTEVREYAKPRDVLVIEDDGDCRWCGADNPVAAWQAACAAVAARLGPRPDGSRPAVVLLVAEPEIEAWILADWPETFGRSPVSGPLRFDAARLRPLRAGVKKGLGLQRWSALARAGCPRVGTACTLKLSDVVAAAVNAETGLRFSKKDHSPVLLRRVRLGPLLRNAGPVFRAAWEALKGHERRTAGSA